MDPFEEKLNSLLENRIKHIEEYISSKIKNDFENSEDVLEEKLPYNIVKTVQYIKQEEYKKRKKILKKLSDY
jgi:hypothetical protein